jgi:cytidylate kinase
MNSWVILFLPNPRPARYFTDATEQGASGFKILEFISDLLFRISDLIYHFNVVHCPLSLYINSKQTKPSGKIMGNSTIPIPMEDLITRQINFWEKSRKKPAVQKSLRHKNLTISQQSGSSGIELGNAVAKRLGWQVYDKEIVNYISENTQVRKHMVELFDEKARTEMHTLISSILDKNSINKEIYFKQLTKTMVTLARHGNAVIIGRGGNFILPDSMALKIFITRDFADRIQEISQQSDNALAAEKELKKNDIVRSLFIRKHFGKDADHPSHFDLVINLSKIDLTTAENIIISALSAKYGLNEEQLKEK